MRDPDQQPDDEPTPVAPAPIETAPSATGVVAGDPDDVREAPPGDD
jgi:hypothetical protein